MKKLIVSVLLVGLTITGFAFSNKTVNSKTEVSAEEGNGIQFQNLSLEAAKKLAKETNKLIFIDVYAAWCGPCKMMARGPFQEEKVGIRRTRIPNFTFHQW
jgi:thioredoxin 1